MAFDLPSAATECRSIPLSGVPQIPDDVEETIRLYGEANLTGEQISRAKAAIGEAEKELQRRILAHKEGMRLEKYFQYTPEQARSRTTHNLRCRKQRERRRAVRQREVVSHEGGEV